LKTHQNTAEYFYKIRGIDRSFEEYSKLSKIERASRTIYLNKTCFNGLFRVNRSGEFNTPFGSYKNPNIVNEGVLRAVSNYFNTSNLKLNNSDFESIVSTAKKGDFVYFDPPYDPVSHTSNFTGYDKGGFDRDEQERLFSVCKKLDKKGVKFLLSNSATEFITNLYAEFDVITIKAKRAINSRADLRGEIDEVLVRNYE
jgi:DNA adenine methylase